MRAIAIATALVASLHATAQQWCPPGATWTYDTGSPWTVAYTRYAYAGDTLVDGQPSQRIEVDALITNWFGNDTTIHSTGSPGLVTRLADEVVFLWRPNTGTWDTLYWFGAEVGDHWRPPWAFEEDCPADHVLTVLETGTMIVDGVELRKLLVERRQGGQSFGNPEWIAERIGPLGGYFFPMGDCGGVIECYCTLGCYRDQEIGYPSGTGDCALPLALSQHENPPLAIELWPNPGSDLLSYAISGMETVDVIVLDAMGRCIVRMRSLPSRGTIDLSVLAEGSYLIAFTNKGGHIATRTWLKINNDR